MSGTVPKVPAVSRRVRAAAVQARTMRAVTLILLVMMGVVYGGFVGGAFASFGCVVSERVPAGLSVGGRSMCACGRQLRAWENVPVLGWVRVRGTARCCGMVIPVRYLFAELALGAVGAALGGWLSLSLDREELSVTRCLLTLSVSALSFAALLAVTWQRGTRKR